jgi:hypothetical protein
MYETQSATTNSPAKNTAMKLANPVTPKMLAIVGVKIFALKGPGPKAPISPIA